ncbi:molecular chaperone [Enterobacter cloacae complex sp. P29RS]|uniref:fimbrial biogenesis chaperone n=1 Tax=Enterobacter cloacae complex sp. P29RS TaxID=2779563 RepID=UPI00186790BC|nr:molecular chaperone [Enterobacter cloacae complex sp. P29RS]MBE3175121.1 molecular chaperone [Enterobacter cloacae complex sp. P29RS]
MLYTNKCCFIAVMAFLSSIFISNIASSSVILKGNRIIYSADAKDKVVEFSNNGDTPMLVQVWLDKNNPDSTPDTADAPFIVTPQIFRINALNGHALRLKFTGQTQPLPQDRESVFWFNYLQYPAIKSSDLAQNRLALIVKSRLKVFYRPPGLRGDASQALTQLQVQRKGNMLTLQNPTPWHISLRNALLTRGEKSTAVGQSVMIPPFGDTRWVLTDPVATYVTVYAMNDYGTAVSHTFTLPR